MIKQANIEWIKNMICQPADPTTMTSLKMKLSEVNNFI